MTARFVLAAIIAVVLSSCAGASSEGPNDVVALAMTTRAGGPPTIEVVEPADGATVTSPFTVRVTTKNMELAPAGRTLDGEGHWHVMVDGECLAAGEVIPKNDSHLHVGSGEDSAEFDLAPGRHTLCVQLGDGFHVAVSVTDVVQINVVSE